MASYLRELMKRQSLGDRLTAQEAATLKAKYQAGDMTAKDQLFWSHARLILNCATDFHRIHRPKAFSVEDLFQVGVVGFDSAIKRYDPNRRTRFSTYLLPWLKQAMQRAIQGQGYLVCLPAERHAELPAILRAIDKAESRGLKPSPEYISQVTGLPVQTINLTLATLNCLSLDGLTSHNDGEPIAWEDFRSDPRAQAAYDLTEFEGTLRSLLVLLTPLESEIVLCSFGILGHRRQSLREIGRLRNRSTEWARRKQLDGLAKLTVAARAAGLEMRDFLLSR